MRVVALLAVRNEGYYLERCLRHLYEQGIQTCLIDNGSTDHTLEIANDYSHRGVFRIDHIPFTGIFEWHKILHYKSCLAQEIEADWFIHHDADEIREAPKPFASLLEGIMDADAQGFNAINSDEFVFIPTSEKDAFEGTDYVKKMQYYYFFQPHKLYRVNTWKKIRGKVDLATSGGHSVMFENRHIYPQNFILRHYILLSKRHAEEKYGKRNYDPKELAKGQNVQRAQFNPEHLQFPHKKDLRQAWDQGTWERADPWVRHFFL